MTAERAWLEIDVDRLRQNARAVQEHGRLIAVVKADAYGLGAVEVARALNGAGVDCFAVSTAEEGATLKDGGVTGDILVLGKSENTRLVKRYGLIQTIDSADYAKSLERGTRVHVSVDTGMHRMGAFCDAATVCDLISACGVKAEGIYTHLSSSGGKSAEDRAYSAMQLNAFDALLSSLKSRNIHLMSHALSTDGVANYGSRHYDKIRVGMALYGESTEANSTPILNVKPVATLKARIDAVKTLEAGECAGYSRSFVADRRTRLATVAIGYADGLPRSAFEGGAYMLVNGRKAPIVCRVCTDMTIIDVTDAGEVATGDTATVFGAELSASQLAGKTNTITTEILCRLSPRVKRVYKSADICM